MFAIYKIRLEYIPFYMKIIHQFSCLSQLWRHKSRTQDIFFSLEFVILRILCSTSDWGPLRRWHWCSALLRPFNGNCLKFSFITSAAWYKKEKCFFFSLFYFQAGCVRAKILRLAALISEDFQPCVERTDWEKFENADFNERTDTSDLNPQYFDCFALSPTLPSTDSSSASCSCNLFAGR